MATLIDFNTLSSFLLKQVIVTPPVIYPHSRKQQINAISHGSQYCVHSDRKHCDAAVT